MALIHGANIPLKVLPGLTVQVRHVFPITSTPALQVSIVPYDSESNQDTVVNARRLPSATYARDSRPSGNATLLR